MEALLPLFDEFGGRPGRARDLRTCVFADCDVEEVRGVTRWLSAVPGPVGRCGVVAAYTGHASDSECPSDLGCTRTPTFITHSPLARPSARWAQPSTAYSHLRSLASPSDLPDWLASIGTERPFYATYGTESGREAPGGRSSALASADGCSRHGRTRRRSPIHCVRWSQIAYPGRIRD
jgi:hypothetical protein